MKSLMSTVALFFISTVLATAVLSQKPPTAKGFIGLAFADTPASRGALVSHVKPRGPAEGAGVKQGDIIVAINNSSVDQAATMIRIISSMAPKEIVRLSIVRATEHRTIAVVLGSADDASGTGDSTANAPPAPAPPSITARPNAFAHPLSVSGYVRLTDPLEQAFTLDAPSGWHSEAGLARRSALQINPYFRSLSPDRMTYLLIGEPTLPSFVPPSQMGNAIGHREGTLYDAGLGGHSLVLHYLPGAQFARTYGETVLQGLCPSFKLSSVQDRPDLAHQGAAHWPTVIPSREDGGEARFTCVHNKQEMEVRVEAATRITRANIGWGVILLQAFITPKGQGDKAKEILNHIIDSTKFSPAWIQKQNNLSQQAAETINRRMQEMFHQQRAFMQRMNSVDENFQSMDELVSGFSTYHDEKTGNSYSLSNANPNKWMDDATGRVISTPTNTQPLWGPAYRQLTRVPH